MPAGSTVEEKKVLGASSEEGSDVGSRELSSEGSGNELHLELHTLEKKLVDLIMRKAYLEAEALIQAHSTIDINFIDEDGASLLLGSVIAVSSRQNSAA